MTVYRIRAVIESAESDDGEFKEIGECASGTWDDVESCSHALGTHIERRDWEQG